MYVWQCAALCVSMDGIHVVTLLLWALFFSPSQFLPRQAARDNRAGLATPQEAHLTTPEPLEPHHCPESCQSAAASCSRLYVGWGRVHTGCLLQCPLAWFDAAEFKSELDGVVDVLLGILSTKSTPDVLAEVALALWNLTAADSTLPGLALPCHCPLLPYTCWRW